MWKIVKYTALFAELKDNANKTFTSRFSLPNKLNACQQCDTIPLIQ